MGVILSWLLPISLPQFYFLSNGKFLAVYKQPPTPFNQGRDASGGGIFEHEKKGLR
ncbi:MAG: hypothetical protein AAFN63_06190 [Pseudomonadota bacterium]